MSKDESRVTRFKGRRTLMKERARVTKLSKTESVKEKTTDFFASGIVESSSTKVASKIPCTFQVCVKVDVFSLLLSPIFKITI
jgi:hypothetical protein